MTRGGGGTAGKCLTSREEEAVHSKACRTSTDQKRKAEADRSWNLSAENTKNMLLLTFTQQFENLLAQQDPRLDLPCP